MKKIILTAVLAILTAFAPAYLQAQTPNVYRLPENNPNPPAYTLPYTTVKVRVLVEKESVRTGPYARFAQKYLGVIGAMSDKVTYTIKEASMDYADPDHKPAPAVYAPAAAPKAGTHNDPGADFPKLLPDRLSMSERTAEDMARDAAQMIFRLRNMRIDLISGDVGEHVYGAGLQSALDEISRLENQYLELFLGRHSYENEVHEFDVVPEAGRNSYIVFRYSPAGGILPDSDLSGTPVVLMTVPEGGIQPAAGDAKKVAGYYRVADWTVCRLEDGQRVLASARMPVYQFGATVAIR